MEIFITERRTLPQDLFFWIIRPVLKFVAVNLLWLGLIFAQNLYQRCAPDLHRSLLVTWMLTQAENISLRRIKSFLALILQQRLLQEQSEHTGPVGDTAQTLSCFPQPCQGSILELPISPKFVFAAK